MIARAALALSAVSLLAACGDDLESRQAAVQERQPVGDEVTVRVREIDNRGRINLTLRGVPQNGEGGEPEPVPTPVAPLV